MINELINIFTTLISQDGPASPRGGSGQLIDTVRNGPYEIAPPYTYHEEWLEAAAHEIASDFTIVGTVVSSTFFDGPITRALLAQLRREARGES